jgi:hypothetical protein
MLSPNEMILTPEQQSGVAVTHPDRLLPEQLARLRMLARSRTETPRMPVRRFDQGGVADEGNIGPVPPSPTMWQWQALRDEPVRHFSKGAGKADQGGWQEPAILAGNIAPNSWGGPDTRSGYNQPTVLVPRDQSGDWGRESGQRRAEWRNDREGYMAGMEGMFGGRNPWMNFNATAPFGYNPPQGLPGSWQGPTMIPTFFNPQGYPYAVPVGGATIDQTLGSGAHIQ